MLGTIGTALSVAGAAKSLFGGGGDGPGLGEQLKLNRDHQVALWEMQLPAMVEGAKKAGLHPLVAAGVNPAQAASISSAIGDTSFADRLTDAGQNISRAAAASATAEQRQMVRMRDDLLLEKMGLENELLRSQITRVNRDTTPPLGGDYNIPGQPASGVKIVPREVIANKGDTEVGKSAAHRLVDFSNGDTARVASGDLQQAIEEGPANWYYQLTRTVPDMIGADGKYVAKKIYRDLTQPFRGGRTRRYMQRSYGP